MNEFLLQFKLTGRYKFEHPKWPIEGKPDVIAETVNSSIKRRFNLNEITSELENIELFKQINFLSKLDGLSVETIEVFNLDFPLSVNNTAGEYNVYFDIEATSKTYKCIQISENDVFTIIDLESNRILNFKIQSGVHAYSVNSKI